jgi:RNA polymerase sigma-70 factor (ECF subfamily)
MTGASSDEQDRNDMARLVAGSDSALDELMQRHGLPLFHYLFRLLQNETEASDLAEEAFVRVYQNCGRFKPAHKFSTWLYTIATNLARDAQRYRARRPAVSLEAERPGIEECFRDTLPDTGPDPSEQLKSSEMAKVVRVAVGALPEELREPLVLSVYEEKSHAEIAAILGCSAKAVEMRLYRARRELRGRLEKVMNMA